MVLRKRKMLLAVCPTFLAEHCSEERNLMILMRLQFATDAIQRTIDYGLAKEVLKQTSLSVKKLVIEWTLTQSS